MITGRFRKFGILFFVSLRYPEPMIRISGFLATLLLLFAPTAESPGCCAVSRAVDQVVNADQTVIILWDAEAKQQHFIRQASFKSDAEEDIGFIVPSPTQPELEEAGDAAFARLKLITAPLVRSGGSGFGCSAAAPMARADYGGIEILERKRVAGFDAVVLKAGSAQALVGWLADNDYAYSEAVAAWARPYIENGWAFTALKVAPGEDAQATREASALRISFQTETPLFPYREPDSVAASKNLGAKDRLLRIYFIANQAYRGEFDPTTPWTGKTVWSGDISAERDALLKDLKLQGVEGIPAKWWLTEFEDQWPYTQAPGDVAFVPAKNQSPVRRKAASRNPPKDPLLLAAGILAISLSLRRRVLGRD